MTRLLAQLLRLFVIWNHEFVVISLHVVQSSPHPRGTVMSADSYQLILVDAHQLEH